MAPLVNVLPVRLKDCQLITQLHQFMLYDLSPSTSADLGLDGCFQGEHDVVDCSAESQVFIAWEQEKPVGFAVVNTAGRIHAEGPIASCETLFILRKYRLKGYGLTTAFALFDRFPGAWEVGSRSFNTPGHTFWRAVVDRYTHGRYNESWFQDATWRGYIQTFVTPVAQLDNIAS